MFCIYIYTFTLFTCTYINLKKPGSFLSHPLNCQMEQSALSPSSSMKPIGNSAVEYTTSSIHCSAAQCHCELESVSFSTTSDLFRFTKHWFSTNHCNVRLFTAQLLDCRLWSASPGCKIFWSEGHKKSGNSRAWSSSLNILGANAQANKFLPVIQCTDNFGRYCNIMQYIPM